MPWWAWFVLAAALLAAEVVLSTDFYLVFFGVAALVVGVLGVAGVPVPSWAQWAVFAVVAVGCLLVYREQLRAWLTRPEKALNREILGKTAIALDEIAAGGTGRVELRGSPWQAHNGGADRINAGERCHVDRVDGLTLHIRKENSH